MKKLLLALIIILLTLPMYSQIYDYDGNAYDTIRINNQVWMQENLKTLHYSDGTAITGIYVWQNEEANAEVYGRYYKWASAMKNGIHEKAQGACPDRWHIPSIAEWDELATYLGGAMVAGGKMKLTGTEFWKTPNTGATNSSGFSALAAGEWDGEKYWLMDTSAVIWSSTKSGTDKVIYKYLNFDDTELHQYIWFDTLSYSVRCIKDIPGIIVEFNNGNTTEAGGTASFTIKLDSKPSHDVSITLSSSNPNEGIVSLTNITFTSNNWFEKQTIVITGVDDSSDDGDINYTINIDPAVSNDELYSGIDADDIIMINEDDEETVGIYSHGNNIETVDIYPNPSINYCIVEISENKQIESIELYSVTGIKQEIEINIIKNQAEIKYRDITKGLYFLKLKSDSGLCTSKVYIK